MEPHTRQRRFAVERLAQRLYTLTLDVLSPPPPSAASEPSSSPTSPSPQAYRLELAQQLLAYLSPSDAEVPAVGSLAATLEAVRALASQVSLKDLSRVHEQLATVLLADLRDKHRFARQFLPAAYAANTEKLPREELSLAEQHACKLTVTHLFGDALFTRFSSGELRRVGLDRTPLDNATRGRIAELCDSLSGAALQHVLEFVELQANKRGDIFSVFEDIDQDEGRRPSSRRSKKKSKKDKKKHRKKKKKSRTQSTVEDNPFASNLQGRLFEEHFHAFVRHSLDASRTIAKEIALPNHMKSLPAVDDSTDLAFRTDTCDFQVLPGEAAMVVQQRQVELNSFVPSIAADGVTLSLPFTCLVEREGVLVLATDRKATRDLAGGSAGGRLLSDLMKEFFILRFGLSSPEEAERLWAPDSSTPLAMEIRRQFSSERAVLRFLLRAVGSGSDSSGRVFEWVHGKEFQRTLTRVFSRPDEAARGMAVRLLWTLLVSTHPTPLDAGKELASLAEFYFAGDKFNEHVRNALFACLIESPAAVANDVDSVITVSFYRTAENPAVWLALLASLRGCDLEARKRALRDIATLLYNNYENTSAVVNLPGWSRGLFSLLIDLPSDRRFDPVKGCFAFTMSILTSTHFEAFLRSPDFGPMLVRTIDELVNFSGYSLQSRNLTSALLLALVTYVSNSTNQLPIHGYDEPAWQNIAVLIDVVRQYTLQTSFWNYGATPGTTKRYAADSELNPHQISTATLRTLSAEQRLVQRVESGEEEDADAEPDASATEARTRSNMTKPRTRERTAESRAAMQASSVSWGVSDPSGLPRFCLARTQTRQVGPNPKHFADSVELTDHGFHWDLCGNFAEDDLVAAVLQLLDQLKVSNLIFDPQLQPHEAAFLKRLYEEIEFWRMTQELTSLVTVRAIEVHNLMTYRKLAHIVRDFIAAKDTKERQALIEEVEALWHQVGTSDL